MGVISKKLRNYLNPSNNRQIIPFSELVEINRESTDIMDTVVKNEDLAQLDPMHAIYIWLQNIISVFAEQVSELKELSEFFDIFEKAEDDYMPQGPPMSPLTRSYFSLWSFFDLTFGPGHETIGSCFIDVVDRLGIPEDFNSALANLQNSRMGIYEHRGCNNNLILLKELITDKIHPCICPAGYMGKEGEIWFARVLPPPTTAVDYHIVMITPYVLLGHAIKEWTDFFARHSIKINDSDRERKMEKLMKCGKSCHYWNDYIMDAYANNRHEVIFLKGIPDLPETLPHSSVNNDR